MPGTLAKRNETVFDNAAEKESAHVRGSTLEKASLPGCEKAYLRAITICG